MNKFTLLSILIVLVCITGSQQACSFCNALTTQSSCVQFTDCQWSGSCKPIANTTACSNQNTTQCSISLSLGQCVPNTDSSKLTTQPCMDVPNPTPSCTQQTSNCAAYSTSTQYCQPSGSNCALNTAFSCFSSLLKSIVTVGFALLMIMMI